MDGRGGPVWAPCLARSGFAEGRAFGARHPSRPGTVGCTGTSHSFPSVSGAVEIVFLVRVLRASPATIGVVFSSAAVSGIVGALTASMLARRVGSARITWVSLTVTR
mgnify:CR=1 FL=1